MKEFAQKSDRAMAQYALYTLEGFLVHIFAAIPSGTVLHMYLWKNAKNVHNNDSSNKFIVRQVHIISHLVTIILSHLSTAYKLLSHESPSHETFKVPTGFVSHA